MDHFPFIVFAVVVVVVIQYQLEVRIGSSISMYDAESGLATAACMPRKSTRSQFLGKMMPLQLVAIGLPLLAHDILPGMLLILAALCLFCLYGNNVRKD